VKPENLFVVSGRGRERVKVVDFGIAKLLGEEREATLTQTGLLMGTPLYLSPEAARGELADERSDLYSLGCVLYFALTGTPPHEDRNAGALVFAHTHLDPELPSERAFAPLPSVLDTITMRCLQKDPALRYPSMAALADALDDARDALDASPPTGSTGRLAELALG
jgi:eukaryotic-like serine/threonine-protein kinase